MSHHRDLKSVNIDNYWIEIEEYLQNLMKEASMSDENQSYENECKQLDSHNNTSAS